MVPPKRGFQKPIGEWNTEEITAQGRQITVKLNGTTIVDANLDDVKDPAMLKTHRDLSKPEGSRGIANTKGHIGFLGHGARVEFRNIRIKELSARDQIDRCPVSAGSRFAGSRVAGSLQLAAGLAIGELAALAITGGKEVRRKTLWVSS